MLNVVIFVLVLCELCNVANSLNKTEEGVCTDDSGNLTCCFNYQLINDTCVVCQRGFIRPNGISCVRCNASSYGLQCLESCSCNIFQRCDNVDGCVNKTITTEPILTTVTELVTVTDLVWNTVKVNLTTYMSVSNVYTRIQNITPPQESTGLLQREIVIYSSVIAGILLALGLTSLVRKYRKKRKGKVTKHGSQNVKQSNSLRQMQSIVESPSSLYDEIDETKLVENAGIRTPQIKHSANDPSKLNDINKTGYIYPIHSEGDSISFHGSEKHVNKSDLTLHESDQNQKSDEFDKDYVASGYLHPYHSIDEDWKEKTHQYDVTHAPSIEVDDSSDSSTQMITDGYLNPYQPLDEDWKQTSHSYEVPVTIHQCQGHSLSSLLPKEGLKGDTKEDNLQNTVNVLNQNQTSVNLKQIANVVNNNKDSLLMPSKIKSTETAVSSENNIEHSNESVSRKEHALDQVGVSDMRKTANVPINCNSVEVQNVIVNASILNGTNIYVQDYTDAKSQ
ncbi:uncharacterized protein [Mytilus edulis]|uniref:uncharacterized protein n=1 Tax=Mytilus edulis TaxID=6550 RepID=UPI0039F146EE